MCSSIPNVRLHERQQWACNTFHYKNRYKSQMPQELKLFIEDNYRFSEIASAISQKFMSEAKSLEDIRNLYTSPLLDSKLDEAAKNYADFFKDDINKLINVARLIRKFEARNMMLILNFENELEHIHKDNIRKYGNPIAPTMSFLNKKYNGDPQAVASAANRFRTQDEIEKMLAFHDADEDNNQIASSGLSTTAR